MNENWLHSRAEIKAYDSYLHNIQNSGWEEKFYKYNVYQAKCSHVIMIIVSNKTITIKEQN